MLRQEAVNGVTRRFGLRRWIIRLRSLSFWSLGGQLMGRIMVAVTICFWRTSVFHVVEEVVCQVVQCWGVCVNVVHHVCATVFVLYPGYWYPCLSCGVEQVISDVSPYTREHFLDSMLINIAHDELVEIATDT